MTFPHQVERTDSCLVAGREPEVGDLTRLAVPGTGEEDADGAPGAAPERIRPLELPGILGRALALTWRAGPRVVALCAGLQVVIGVGVAGQLAFGRRVVEAVLDGSVDDSIGDVTPELIALALLTAAVSVATALLSERQQMLAVLVERNVQDRILDVVADVEVASFESPAFHDRLRRASLNASQRSWQVSLATVSFFSAATTFTALAFVIGRIEPVILPGVVLAYIPLHLATTRNGRASYEFNYAMTTPDRERAYLGGLLVGRAEVKEVRLFASAPWIRGRYDRLYDRRIDEFRALSSRRLRRSLIAGAGTILVTMAGVGLLIHWALTDRITAAEAGIAAVALQQLGTRMRSLGLNAGALHECSLFLQDVTTFLQMPTERDRLDASATAPDRFSRLVVDDLSFTYPGTRREVLHGVSLEIGAEEVVALVGANGSGKTTLAKLLCGLYEPSAGRILWDDVDVATYDQRSVRRRVAAVFQDFVRYQLTGRQNVGLGDTQRMDAEGDIVEAARSTGADRILASLPRGYDTRLSREYDDGADLSIGEWQRVALARAFFRDAPFLVLDEPTASLDAHAEHELFDAMHLLQRGRAVLVISHRFSSVRSADRIYVLDDGRIIESGTHEQLMALGGRYATLFALQAAAYVDLEPPVR